MINLFYSDHCEFCKKILEHLHKYNLISNIKLINIDRLKKIPDNITVVPTIVDSYIDSILEGKQAFDYLITQQFFYYPTNNTEYWQKSIIPKPNIKNDDKAVETHNFDYACIDNNSDKAVEETTHKIITNKKLLTLIKLKKN